MIETLMVATAALAVVVLVGAVALTVLAEEARRHLELTEGMDDVD